MLSCPHWLSDSLLFTAPPVDAAHGPGLARLHLRDGRIEQPSSPPVSRGVDAHPRQGPVGTVAFLRGDETGRSLWLLDTEGRERHVEYPSSMACGLAWLADGHRERLAWPRPGALSRAIDVAQDGRLAVIARTDRIEVGLQRVER